MRLLTLRTILAATDLDRSSDDALTSAYRLARSAGAVLHVVHVTGSRSGTASLPAATDRDVSASLAQLGIPEGDAKVHLIPGPPAETIRALAERLEADVIVVGPHRARSDAAEGGRLGSTARAIVEHATAPCLVVGRPLRVPLERVLVAIDLSETARGALLVALSWASALRAGSADERGTTLDVLHVDTGAGPSAATTVEHELAFVRDSAGDWAGVAVAGRTERGADAAQRITRRAEESGPDLVVLGTRGLGLGAATTLGSVSASVVTALHLPILLVPPAVWRDHERTA